MVESRTVPRGRRWGMLVLTLLWMAIIFGLSSLHGADHPYPMPWWKWLERKGAHVFEFFVLTGLLFETFRVWLAAARPRMLVALAGAVSLAYAFSDELHQLFVPGREGKLSDIGIDLIGIVLAIVLLVYLTRRQKHRSDTNRSVTEHVK